jgi:hypothetical protein
MRAHGSSWELMRAPGSSWELMGAHASLRETLFVKNLPAKYEFAS